MARFLLIAVVAIATVCTESHLIKILNKADGELEIDIEDEVHIDQEPAVSHCTPARPCPENPRGCRLPNCRCSGNDIPGNLNTTQTPQMIVLSFTNALRAEDAHLFDDVFQGRKNPNGCPAVGTFFVSGVYTDFYLVQKRYHERHEIANNGVEEKNISWWKEATTAQWQQQMESE